MSEEKQSWFKKYVYDPGPSSATPTQATPTNIPATPTQATPVVTRTFPTASQGINEQMKADMLAFIQKRTPADLNDFYETVESMKEAILDEASCYRSSLIAFQKSSKKGVEVLLAGLDKRKAALDETIKSTENDFVTAVNEIASQRAEATKLEEQIKELQQRKAAMFAEAQQSENDLNKQKDEFVATSEAVRSQIQGEADKLVKYLSPQSTTTTFKNGKGRK